MTKFTIETNVDFSLKEISDIEEIFLTLIKTGGLTGVKNGSTIIHFDHEGMFQGVQFDYWPWRRRSRDKKYLPISLPISEDDEKQLTNYKK